MALFSYHPERLGEIIQKIEKNLVGPGNYDAVSGLRSLDSHLQLLFSTIAMEIDRLESEIEKLKKRQEEVELKRAPNPDLDIQLE